MPRSACTRVMVLVAVFAATASFPAAAHAAPYGSRTLKSGMTGSDVKLLQRYLGRVGHRVGTDGEFGPRTVRGLKATERDLELRADASASTRDQVIIRRAVSQAVTGGANYVAPPPPARVVKGQNGKVTSAGFAVPPSSAPASVKAVIAAGNVIAKTPYKWGGGHGSWTDSGYDCSGSVSYALHAGGLVSSPMVSGGFSNWGQPGPGSWITVYSNGGHVYMYVAGLRFDTSARASSGSRWTTAKRSNAGFAVTHPTGL
jgi:cell wall-associated NlpC family hydrolase